MVILDDDDDLRQAVRETVETLSDHACLALESYEAMVRRRDQVLACQLAILDINLGSGRPSGIDAYHWLRQQGYRGRVVFLTGHAISNPLVAEARKLGDVRVLEKPVHIDVFDSILAEDAT